VAERKDDGDTRGGGGFGATYYLPCCGIPKIRIAGGLGTCILPSCATVYACPLCGEWLHSAVIDPHEV